MRPYKSRVAVQTTEGLHSHLADSTDAQEYVQRGYAVALEDGRAFIGTIRLRLSLAAIREELMPRQKAPGRPKPSTRPPASSTGDAGRGLALVARYRVLHMDRQAAIA